MSRFALGSTFVVLSMVPPVTVSRQIGYDGIGPVRVGMTVPQAERVLHAKLTMDTPQDSDSADWTFFSIEGRGLPISYMVERGRITRADLGRTNVKGSIKTANGIGIKSNIAEIKRAYGTRGTWHPNAYSDEPIFEIKSADGKSAILFETEHRRIVHIVAGRLPSAEYIEGCE